MDLREMECEVKHWKGTVACSKKSTKYIDQLSNNQILNIRYLVCNLPVRCLVPREQSAHLPTFMPVTCPHTNYTCTQHIILLINNSVIIGKQFRTPPHALQYYRNDSFKCFEVIALGSFRNTEIKFPTQSHPATEGRMRRNRKLV